MSTDQSPERPRLNRREWMKRIAASAAASALVPAEALGALGALPKPRAGLEAPPATGSQAR